MKKIRILLLIIIGLFFCSTNAFAATIIISGYGINADDAERDALRNAVEKAVGSMVESETLVEKNVVLKDEIYTSSKGFIENYTVIKKEELNNSWEVTINANVNTDPDSKLMNELTKLGIISKQLRDPRIAVIMPEYHISAKIPDPAAETAIIRKLVDSGFSRVTDVSMLRYHWNNILGLSQKSLQEIANDLQVDIVIVGEAFSEGVGDVGKFIGNGRSNVGIVSCKARAEAKIFILKTGEILAANGTYGTAADLTEFIAAKKALNNAGEKMGDYIIEKLMAYGGSNNQNLQINVLSVDFNKVSAINRALKDVRGVGSSSVTNYADGLATITVKYSGTPQLLYSNLSGLVDFNLNLRETTYNTLTISLY